MQRLQDRQWQARHLAASGVAYVPGDAVARSYAQLAEAADVLGRADLARAIAARATPELCRRHAAVLAVLLRAARNPLAAPLPEFSYVAPPSDREVWADAMGEIQADLEVAQFSSEDEAGGADPRAVDDLAGESAGESAGDSAGDSVGKLAGNFAGPQLAGGGLEEAAQLLDLDPPRAAAPPAAELSHAALVRELALALLGLPAVRSAAVRGLSRRCAESVWARIDRCAAALAALPAAATAAARAEVLAWRCASVLQLAVRAERLVATYRRQPRRVDTSGVRMLLEGDARSPAVVESGAQLQLAPRLPTELQHPLLLDAGRCGVLAVRLHGALLPRVELPRLELRGGARQYAAAVCRAYVHNAGLLMSGGVRERLVAAWEALAAVFLGQDARTLVLLDALVQQDALVRQDAPVQDVPGQQHAAQRTLREVWPDAPVVLDADGVPVYTQPLDGGLEQALGRGLDELFPRRQLRRLWCEMVRAFRAGDQAVELAMAQLTAAVRARIRAADTLRPFV